LCSLLSCISDAGFGHGTNKPEGASAERGGSYRSAALLLVVMTRDVQELWSEKAIVQVLDRLLAG